MDKARIFTIFNIFILGLPLVCLVPAIELWGVVFLEDFDDVRINTISSNGLAFILITFILIQFKKFAGTNILAYVLPTVSLIYLSIFTYFVFTRFGYSRHVLMSGLLFNAVYFFGAYFLVQKYQITRYAILPFGKIQSLTEQPISKNIKFTVLSSPQIPEHLSFKGIIADLHAPDLDSTWTKFLAQCTLQRIPVFHVKQVQESLTGKIQIDHLSENQFGTLLPSPFYMFFKRCLDLIIVVLALPLLLPIMFVTAIAIRIESSGDALFLQERVGQGNKTFRIYKFRSMYTNAEYQGAQLAQTNDQRITKVGKWIRKTRLDELPQIWNVIRGDMSIIGPRPEQRTFVNQFEDSIPFYIYRHVVKPGMTGWAQVTQGYASDENETMVKIQYDFYYIKHFSFWLDILILFKTFRVIITGFGAK